MNNMDIIELNIPRKADYISLTRLTASGIAHNLGLSIDEIEDIKVSLGEACINSFASNNIDKISIVFQVEEKLLSIRVSDVKEVYPNSLEEFKELELGLLIIKSLMDEVRFNEFGIEMIKYIEDDSQ